MRYPDYAQIIPTDSGWIPFIPPHWKIRRLRHLLFGRLEYGANESAELDDSDLPRYIRITDINENDSLREETFRSLPEDVARPYLLQDGDILFARSGATSGKTFLYRTSWGRCAYAGYLIRARLRKSIIMPDFLRYYTASSTYWQWLSSSYVQATIQNVSAEKYADLELPIPPIEEQQAIVRFLDAKTAKIDELIAKKRELIEKLKEKRSALIARTVTQGLPPEAAQAAGLDSHPKMKDSGVEWLNYLPESWRLLPMTKYLSEMSDYRGKTPEKTDEGVFLVTARNVRMGYIDYECSQEYVAVDEYEEIMRRGLPKTGDILFTTEAPLGNVALVDREDIALAQRIMRFRFKRNHFVGRFALYAMLSDYFQSQLKSLSTGSTAEGLKASKLTVLRMVAPPIHEQQIIVEFLDSEFTKLALLISKTESALSRLHEYRQALITAAVTGKIDVREAA